MSSRDPDWRMLDLADIRKGLPNEPDAVQVLSRLAYEFQDQQLEKAALAGLARHATPEALLGIARRALSTWGVGAITRANQLCGKLQPQGGLVILSSTLFLDNRFINTKLELMKKALSKCEDEMSLKKLDALPDVSELYQEARRVNDWRSELSHIASLDVREAVMFGSQFKGHWGWTGSIPPTFTRGEIKRATQYVERRIPGIEKLFDETFDRLTG